MEGSKKFSHNPTTGSGYTGGTAGKPSAPDAVGNLEWWSSCISGAVVSAQI